MHRLGLNDDFALTAGIAIKPLGNDKRRKRSRDSDGDDRSQIGAARREIGGTAARRDLKRQECLVEPLIWRHGQCVRLSRQQPPLDRSQIKRHSKRRFDETFVSGGRSRLAADAINARVRTCRSSVPNPTAEREHRTYGTPGAAFAFC